MVQAIPEGREGVIPHLTVNDGQAALEFYKKAFGATILYAAEPDANGKLMHAEFEMKGSIMYLADDYSGTMGGDMASPKKLNGVGISPSFYVEDVDATIEKAVAAGAEIVMPAMDMFWGDRYGQLKDPFGHIWSFSTHIKDSTPEEQEAAMQEFRDSMDES